MRRSLPKKPRFLSPAVIDTSDDGTWHPNIWELLTETLYLLSESAGKEAEIASSFMLLMLKDETACRDLMLDLMFYVVDTEVQYENLSAEELPSKKKIAKKIRIQHATEGIKSLPDQFAKYGRELHFVLMSMDNHTSSINSLDFLEAKRTALSNIENAIQPIIALCEKAEAAAPSARGRQPDPAVAARLALCRSVYQTYSDFAGYENDAAFWELFAALWEKLTGAEELPQKQRLKKFIKETKLEMENSDSANAK